MKPTRTPLTVSLLATTAAQAATDTPRNQPNIIAILADDLGYEAL